jgi:hypothetical protein
MRCILVGGTTRRVSYFPSASTGGRGVSLFEQPEEAERLREAQSRVRPVRGRGAARRRAAYKIPIIFSRSEGLYIFAMVSRADGYGVARAMRVFRGKVRNFAVSQIRGCGRVGAYLDCYTTRRMPKKCR